MLEQRLRRAALTELIFDAAAGEGRGAVAGQGLSYRRAQSADDIGLLAGDDGPGLQRTFSSLSG